MTNFEEPRIVEASNWMIKHDRIDNKCLAVKPFVFLSFACSNRHCMLDCTQITHLDGDCLQDSLMMMDNTSYKKKTYSMGKEQKKNVYPCK